MLYWGFEEGELYQNRRTILIIIDKVVKIWYNTLKLILMEVMYEILNSKSREAKADRILL